MSLEGPFGKFSYQNIPQKNQIWMAGGIGITPFLSMARSLNDSDYRIDLFYCTSEKDEAVYSDELQNIAWANKNFRMLSWCSGENGRINASTVAKLSNGLEQKAILLCGPPPFMQSLKKQFLKLGVSRSSIYSEDFQFN